MPSKPDKKRRPDLEATSFKHAQDVELLAAILGGSTEKAQKILIRFSGLLGVQRATFQQLAEAGLTPTNASAVCSAFALTRRVALLEAPFGRPIRSPEDVSDFLRATYGSEAQETFVALGLDAQTRLRSVHVVAVGTANGVHTHPRDVFRPMIEAGMVGVLLAHNHPSGNPEPSDDDVQITKRMIEAGRLLGVHVLDHVIVARGRTHSMAEHGDVDFTRCEGRGRMK